MAKSKRTTEPGPIPAPVEPAALQTTRLRADWQAELEDYHRSPPRRALDPVRYHALHYLAAGLTVPGGG